MWRFLFFWCLSSVVTTMAFAQDVIRLPSLERANITSTYYYEQALIKAALLATQHDFGPYTIEFADKYFPRNRTLAELELGKVLNVVPIAISAPWEERTIPVYFPLYKGVVGYRMFLIHKKNLATFRRLENITQLKSLTAGQDYAWSSGKKMKQLGFKVYNNTGFDRLMVMLDHGHFQYFPHGIHEIHRTKKTKAAQFDNIVIEPSKLLLIFQPVWFFVSPKHPRIAKRLEKGLHRMLDSGVFDKIFAQFHDVKKLKADVDARTLLNAIPDNTYTHYPSLNNPKYWFYGWPLNHPK